MLLRLSDDLLPLTLTADITANPKTDPQRESPALLHHHHHYAHASSSKTSSAPTNLHKKHTKINFSTDHIHILPPSLHHSNNNHASSSLRNKSNIYTS